MSDLNRSQSEERRARRGAGANANQFSDAMLGAFDEGAAPTGRTGNRSPPRRVPEADNAAAAASATATARRSRVSPVSVATEIPAAASAVADLGVPRGSPLRQMRQTRSQTPDEARGRISLGAPISKDIKSASAIDAAVDRQNRLFPLAKKYVNQCFATMMDGDDGKLPTMPKLLFLKQITEYVEKHKTSTGGMRKIYDRFCEDAAFKAKYEEGLDNQTKLWHFAASLVVHQTGNKKKDEVAAMHNSVLNIQRRYTDILRRARSNPDFFLPMEFVDANGDFLQYQDETTVRFEDFVEDSFAEDATARGSKKSVYRVDASQKARIIELLRAAQQWVSTKTVKEFPSKKKIAARAKFLIDFFPTDGQITVDLAYSICSVIGAPHRARIDTNTPGKQLTVTVLPQSVTGAVTEAEFTDLFHKKGSTEINGNIKRVAGGIQFGSSSTDMLKLFATVDGRAASEEAMAVGIASSITDDGTTATERAASREAAAEERKSIRVDFDH